MGAIDARKDVLAIHSGDVFYRGRGGEGRAGIGSEGMLTGLRIDRHGPVCNMSQNTRKVSRITAFPD